MKTSKMLDVYFDYACPFCYLGLHYLKECLPDFPRVRICWQACEAHPRPEKRMTTPAETGWWQQYIAPAAQAAGLPLGKCFSPVPHSDKAFEGMHFLVSAGADDRQLWAYHDAVFRALYVRGQDIEETGVLLLCAKEAGADVGAFAAALDEGRFATQEAAALRHAYEEVGIQVVPTYKSGAKVLAAASGIGLTKAQVSAFLQSL